MTQEANAADGKVADENISDENGADEKAKTSKRIKVISTVLVFAAVVLQLWGAIAPLSSFLYSLAKVTVVVLAIHAVEGIISAALILRYRLRGDSSSDSAPTQSSAILTQKLPKSTPLAVFKAGLYAFFVGTIGLMEVVDATKPAPEQLERSS